MKGLFARTGNDQSIDDPYYSSYDLMAELNENLHPRKNLWSGLTITIFVIIGLISFLYIGYETKQLIFLIFIIPSFLLTIVFVTFTSYDWIDYFKRYKKLRNIHLQMNKAISNVTLPSTCNDTKVRELLKVFRHERRINLFLNVASYLVVLIFLIVGQGLGLWEEGYAKNMTRIATLLLLFIPTLIVQLYLVRRGIKDEMPKTYIKNLKKGDRNQKALELLMSKNAPFALYLRDFEPENDFFHGSPPHTSSRYGMEERERILLKEMAKIIPIFSFLNCYDMNSDPIAIQLNLTGSSWKESFRRYADKATLIVIDVRNLSNGLEFELRWIEENNAGSKSFLVLKKDVADAFQRKFPGLVSAVSWHTTMSSNREYKIPDGLLDYLNRNNQSVRLY